MGETHRSYHCRAGWWVGTHPTANRCWPHSPYGTQTVLISVAWDRNVRPSPSAPIQFRARPWLTQVRLRLAGGLALDEGGEGVGGEAPHCVDVHVAGEGFGEVLRRAGDDVDDPGGDVGGVEDLVEVGGRQGVLAGDEDHRVAHRDGGGHEGDEAEEGGLVGAKRADHAGGFVHRKGDAADRDGFGGAVVFVGPGGVGEEALDGGVDLGLRRICR